MNLRFIDWIWTVRGSVPLGATRSGDQILDRLDPLFRQAGTSHERTGETLTFTKKDQAAQDRMSIFDEGTLQVTRGASGPVLRYRLTSRILLFCFFLPFLFLGFAQLTLLSNAFNKPTPEAAAKAKKEAEAAEKKKPVIAMNPLDKALGAPAPEQPRKGEKKDEDDKNPTPTPAYVFAAIFATLYAGGRVLEDRLFRVLLKKTLTDA